MDMDEGNTLNQAIAFGVVYGDDIMKLAFNAKALNETRRPPIRCYHCQHPHLLKDGLNGDKLVVT